MLLIPILNFIMVKFWISKAFVTHNIIYGKWLVNFSIWIKAGIQQLYRSKPNYCCKLLLSNLIRNIFFILFNYKIILEMFQNCWNWSLCYPGSELVRVY